MCVYVVLILSCISTKVRKIFINKKLMVVQSSYCSEIIIELLFYYL